ncbi:MAG: 5-(carboxyamino)imidazole ribonucleotide mutase [Acidobacteriota bacterium]|nr:5-(carboxyamino)imidazole ribonucleotide mutase [Acidobacteriota bacterium]
MGSKQQARVAVVMGSASDLSTMMETIKILREFDVAHEVEIASAHRTPERSAEIAAGAAKRGIRVLIAGAGMANHLAGALAARSTLPVIAVPLASSALGGLDALLSSVQMPPGVPVATVAIGAAGARNAAYLALQILGVSDEAIQRKLQDHKKEMARKVERSNNDARREIEKSSG